MLWAPSLLGVIGGALITGLSFATLYPITVARLSQRFGVAARSIGAIMFSLAAVGPAVLPWMVGVISHATGSLRAGLLLLFCQSICLSIFCCGRHRTMYSIRRGTRRNSGRRNRAHLLEILRAEFSHRKSNR